MPGPPESRAAGALWAPNRFPSAASRARSWPSPPPAPPAIGGKGGRAFES